MGGVKITCCRNEVVCLFNDHARNTAHCAPPKACDAFHIIVFDAGRGRAKRTPESLPSAPFEVSPEAGQFLATFPRVRPSGKLETQMRIHTCCRGLPVNQDFKPPRSVCARFMVVW